MGEQKLTTPQKVEERVIATGELLLGYLLFLIGNPICQIKGREAFHCLSAHRPSLRKLLLVEQIQLKSLWAEGKSHLDG